MRNNNKLPPSLSRVVTTMWLAAANGAGCPSTALEEMIHTITHISEEIYCYKQINNCIAGANYFTPNLIGPIIDHQLYGVISSYYEPGSN